MKSHQKHLSAPFLDHFVNKKEFIRTSLMTSLRFFFFFFFASNYCFRALVPLCLKAIAQSTIELAFPTSSLSSFLNNEYYFLFCKNSEIRVPLTAVSYSFRFEPYSAELNREHTSNVGAKFDPIPIIEREGNALERGMSRLYQVDN